MSRRLVLPLLLVLAACESATAPTNTLTTEEATAAFSALQLVGFSTMQPTVRDGGALLLAPSSPTVMQRDTIALSRSCPAGGRSNAVAIVGTDSTQITFDIRQRFDNCAVTSDSGRTWTFDADPGLRTQMDFGYTGTLTFSGSMAGAFTFASEGKSGRGTVDLNLVLVSSDSVPRVEARGTFCGRDISRDFDVGV